MSYQEYCKNNRFVAFKFLSPIAAEILINDYGVKAVDYVVGNLHVVIKEFKAQGYKIFAVPQDSKKRAGVTLTA